MRLIDADALLRALPDDLPYKGSVRRVLMQVPEVDAGLVIRCKDCKHLVNATVNANGFLICDINDMEIAPDDFCSYGERREGKSCE